MVLTPSEVSFDSKTPMMIAKMSFVFVTALLALNNCARLPNPLANPCLQYTPRSDDVEHGDVFFGQSETIDISQILNELIISMREAKHSVNQVKEALEDSNVSSRLIRQLWGQHGLPEAEPEIHRTFTQSLKADYNETSKTWLILNTLEGIVDVPNSAPVRPAIRRCKEKLLMVMCKLREMIQAENEEVPALFSFSYRFKSLSKIRAYFRNAIRLYTHYRFHFANRNRDC